MTTECEPGAAAQPRCIYVVEDDPDVSRLVLTVLGDSGFEASPCRSAAELRRRLLVRVPDLCIVDLVLPDADGMDLVRQLRSQHGCGLIILTGYGHIKDPVMGLELGADDFVDKPFEPRELVARVRAVLGRLQPRAFPDRHSRPAVAAFAGCTFHVDSNILRSPDGREWPLSTGEAKTLTVLLKHPNRQLGRSKLAGGRDLSPFDRSIDVRIARLRSKIGHDPQHSKTIRTINGVGYLLNTEVTWL